MSETPEAVLFDLGGTLLREARLEVDAAISWLLDSAGAARRGEVAAELHSLYAEIRQSLRAQGTEFPVRAYLKLALDLTGASTEDGVERFELEFWRRLCSMEPLPGVRGVLAELQRRGVKTAVVSNSAFSAGVLEYELDRNGLLGGFSVVISSADYGIQKPHPMIFKAALARLGCEPGRAWFVGDNFGNDALGASGVGMRAVWLAQGDAHELPVGSVRITAWREFLPLFTIKDRDGRAQMTQCAMRIRLATIEDAPAISELIRPLAAKYIAHEFSAEGAENLLRSMTPEAIEGYLRSGYRYHVAEKDGELAGVVATRDNRHLYHLFVAEPYQRRGLAREMWAVTKQACLEAGGAGDFTVNSSRYAVGLYRKLGFVEAGPPAGQNGVVSIPMRSAPPSTASSPAG